ncbi:ATP-dependent helicase [Nocardia rhamnosiphila]|uniref:ATP-dependent helicase n=1 Tax=Nocardia rhamnosiphila TaxID=426716 RepID=UPI0004C45F22|nr:UvrD-helicase domain-containing protein [Nocardia rhamnosiphila]
MSARVSPGQLADALGLPPPTAEQAAVIAAPSGPALVVAGAGAGKTETMAARVVWMVANRLVTPEEVLGLTFTRKAAQQLTARIRTRLARLAGSRLLRDLDPSGELRATLAGAEPEISTYHSYAGRLLSEHGLLLPVEPSAALLTETQLWQLAHQVVRGWDGDLDTDRSPLTVTEAVLALSGQLAEHLVEPEELAEAHTELEKLVHTLPAGPRQRGGPNKGLLSILRAQRERVALLPLVQQLRETLHQRGALDFGAQMSLAARLAAEHPDVATAERARFRLVLLDEYQDTGHAQRILLSALFGAGYPEQRDPRSSGARRRELAVTAVGDPMQSIYGWRGASAANLPRFTTDFPVAPGIPAPVLPLLTSWRNPPEALDLANMVVEPLRAAARDSGGVTVDPLRPKPGAEPGVVALALTDTVASERRWIAERIAAHWAEARAAERPPPTSAVLIRRNADAAELAEELRAQGLPVEIVGLGGLLSTPEVADIVATLRLVADPAAGSAAVRILTGARWRIGSADLAALARRARELSITRDPGGDITDSTTLAAALHEVAPEPAERAGLADAIADPGPPDRYSAAGYRRLTALGRELAMLRERAAQPLTELVADVERTIGVGVESQARRALAGSGAGREHLDAFAEVVAGFANDTGATLGGLLAFLTAAESVENGLEPGEVEVAPDRVQVLTVHAAKGLEWEVVAVPHVTRDVFPSTRGVNTWLGALAELPTSLRGDRATAESPDGVPVLDLSEVTDRAELQRGLTAHKEALAWRRLDEDRRLFYVALTRTERVLLVSAHHWPETGDKPKGPSEFLLEVKTAAEQPGSGVEIACWAADPEPGEPNPLAAAPVTASWPGDPLGARRDDIEAGAALVHAALAEFAAGADAPESGDDPDGWIADVDALLAEYRAGADAVAQVELPTQLPATALVEMRADPGRLAARLRRPLPYPPNPLARRGTAFHAWVQRWFATDQLPGLDDLPGAADAGAAADAELARMQDAFLSSPWSARRPVEIEVPFETTIAGVVIRGRMDAVFAEPGGGWTVVDWKTGAEPGPADEAAVAVQLAVYRLAWARLVAARTGETEQRMLDRIGAAFHYVRSGRTVAPERLPGPEELVALLTDSTRRDGDEN